jgi:hypothetical protein
MDLFYPLQLPSTPLKIDIFREGLPNDRKKRLSAIGSYSISYDWKNLLSEELILEFLKIGIEPYCIAFFMFEGKSEYGKNLYRHKSDAYIHSDISVNDNETGYDDVPFSINWQLSPGSETWHWWNTGTINPTIPNIDKNQLSVARHLQGKHYGFPHPEFKEIRSACLNGPTMVRTDIPHSITYNVDPIWYNGLYNQGLEPTRSSIGVRFNHKEIKTWEQGIKIFSPIFQKS